MGLLSRIIIIYVLLLLLFFFVDWVPKFVHPEKRSDIGFRVDNEKFQFIF